jgi:hypothetical protein
MLPKYIEDACEEIDTALFTGDAFQNAASRKVFIDYLERWQRGVANIIVVGNTADIVAVDCLPLLPTKKLLLLSIHGNSTRRSKNCYVP